MKRLTLLLFAFLAPYISSTTCAQQPTALQQTQRLTELQQPATEQATPAIRPQAGAPQSQLVLQGQKIATGAQQPKDLQPQQPTNLEQIRLRKILFNPTQYIVNYKITFSDNTSQTGDIAPGGAAIVESTAPRAAKLLMTPNTSFPSRQLPSDRPDEYPLGNPVGDIINTNYFFAYYLRKIIGTNPLPDGPARDQHFKDFAQLESAGKNYIAQLQQQLKQQSA